MLFAIAVSLAQPAASEMQISLTCKLDGSPWERVFELHESKSEVLLGSSHKRAVFTTSMVTVYALESGSYAEIYHINRSNYTLALTIYISNKVYSMSRGTCRRTQS